MVGEAGRRILFQPVSSPARNHLTPRTGKAGHALGSEVAAQARNLKPSAISMGLQRNIVIGRRLCARHDISGRDRLGLHLQVGKRRVERLKPYLRRAGVCTQEQSAQDQAVCRESKRWHLEGLLLGG